MTDGLAIACMIIILLIIGLNVGAEAQKTSIATLCEKYQMFHIEEVGYKCEILTKKGE